VEEEKEEEEEMKEEEEEEFALFEEFAVLVDILEKFIEFLGLVEK
jgi:hypothetical protein